MKNEPKKMRTGQSKTALWLLAATLLTVTACKKESEEVAPQVDPVATTDANTKVNNWILDNMRELYYWNDKIPASPDLTLAPSDFFDSILNTYDATTNPEGDRFSWIEESAQDLTASLSGESTTTGMEYNLYLRAQNSDAVIAQVLYVLPGSPAQKAGILRGDIITKVNGQSLSRTNYAALLFSGTTFTFGLAQVSNQTLVDTDVTKTVTATVFQENPVLLDSVYSVGGKTIGYVVYNQFIPGPNNNSSSTVYDQQLDAIFAKFKAQGVNELVLDLRYNSGGYTSSSANLASLIGRGVDASKIYFTEKWNSTITPYLQKEYGDEFFNQRFTTKSQNIGGNLSRIYVLTTAWTASASELIINGLRPYMTVNTIGTTTYGKNVGSITVTDDSSEIAWGMQPIVFKSFNSLGQSDYSTGFTPSVEVEEPLLLQPLGDTREAMLSAALAQITGTPTARQGVTDANPLTGVGSSLKRKAGAGGWMVKRAKVTGANL